MITSTQTINPTHCTPSLCAVQWRGSVTAYDAYGEVTTTIDGRGVTVAGGVVTMDDPAGLYTRHTSYNAQGDQTSVSTPAITTTLGGSTRASTPVTTTYGYDGDGNQTTMVFGHGGC